MSIIKTDNVLFEYIRRDEQGNAESITTALDHVNIDVEPGEFIAILGVNGSGKSTLARHLNALLVPEEGSVWVDDMNTHDTDSILDIRKTAGMVFQNPDNQIIANIVEEDVAFGPENLGVSPEEISERVDFALKKTGMEDRANSSPMRLSGGQKQRVAIAGVLAMRPKCIVLDEATAMLDPEGREEVMSTLEEINKKDRVTVILITHYMEEAIRAGRVIVMDEGSVVMDGTPKEIFSKPETVMAYGLRLPQVTELAWELRKAGMDIPLGILDARELADAICQ